MTETNSVNSNSSTETTPLLRKESKSSASGPSRWYTSVVLRVLFTSFLVSTSFGVTQVPLVYVFGLMTCDEYYKTHSDLDLGSTRCKIPEIEASTARAIALLGAGTTLFGVVNLFFTGWSIKRFGVKTALVTSVAWPVIRLLVQNVGVEAGGGLGINIVQASQIITIFGGPAGYLLALNSFATEVVDPVDRTATLGRLQGVAFFGTSVGFLAGGLISDIFGTIAPFRVTLALFAISALYVSLFLPRLPNNITPEQLKKTASLSAFFEPLRMFVPQKWILKDGHVQREYGISLLGTGAFLALLATGYIGTLLQMYATDELDFGTTENGWLIAVNAMVRGLFLTFAFPVIITRGRAWLDKRQQSKEPSDKISAEESAIPDIPISAQEFEPGPIEGEADQEPVEPPKPRADGEGESFQFDLLYTRYSILVDGVLTALATFATKGWHLYIVAVVLPLAAGTGSAAKGTILQMCSPSQRADALSAISLVEMVARLATVGLFGYVFAAFAAIGEPSLTFTANGAVAILAFVVLLLTRFPPQGARRIEDSSEEAVS
ncbi:MFS general substrate transporter [Lecanosticta acicola]|uniref:MFS general substrate transporter n=1 Tax=Lecanosticta acicola TaxID=111012 RepID=A0AAI8Z5V8_9PEZI|nr:MFS general substrate transporter [Lecanosticta acicola]